jgi:hypothetical protein
MTTQAKEIKMEIVPQELGLDRSSTESLTEAFAPFFKEAQELIEEAKLITDPKEARVARIKLQKVRTGAKKVHKEQKAAAWLFGKGVDGVNNFLLAGIVPVEKSLEAIEKAEERRIADELAELVAFRTAQLKEYAGDEAFIPDVGAMTDDQFRGVLGDAMVLHKVKAEAAKQAAEDQAKRQAEEAAERVRVAKENEQLKKEAAEREAAMQKEREKAEALRLKEAKAAEVIRAKEAAQAQAEAKKAAEELEAFKAYEAAEKKKADAVAAEERAAREKVEAEAQALRDERLAVAAQLSKAKEDAEKAPDKEKLLALAAAIRGLENPALTSTKGKVINKTIDDSLEKFAVWLEKEAGKI